MGLIRPYKPRGPRPDLAERNRTNATHGMTKTPTFKSWDAMRQRINNPQAKDFPRYGGRGLDMDPRWCSFESFLSDLGKKPPGTTLGRIDNERGYWPNNCRWETHFEQQNNKRSSRKITAHGRTMTIAQWAREVGTSRQTIRYRLEAGWPPELVVDPIVNHGVKLADRIAG